VGRILRQKHSSPLVIDIIDEHDIFMSQWYKRRKYYKSQNYKILVCDNHEYTDGHNKDLSKWKVSWEPKISVSKKTHPTQTSGQKSIAEQLMLTLSIPKKGDNGREECDECEKEEEEHESKRKKGKGKSGLADKGCLLDVSALFKE
jgi:hypothetical protein